jgi:hypothetical protein
MPPPRGPTLEGTGLGTRIGVGPGSTSGSPWPPSSGWLREYKLVVRRFDWCMRLMLRSTCLLWIGVGHSRCSQCSRSVCSRQLRPRRFQVLSIGNYRKSQRLCLHMPPGTKSLSLQLMVRPKLLSTCPSIMASALAPTWILIPHLSTTSMQLIQLRDGDLIGISICIPSHTSNYMNLIQQSWEEHERDRENLMRLCNKMSDDGCGSWILMCRCLFLSITVCSVLPQFWSLVVHGSMFAGLAAEVEHSCFAILTFSYIIVNMSMPWSS